MYAKDIIGLIEKTAQPRLAAPWDKSGLQILGERKGISRLAVALDPLPEVIDQTLDWKADFILTHHPLSLDPQLPNRDDAYRHVLKEVLASGSWLYAAHTSLDARSDGPVAWLAQQLRLDRLQVLETTIHEAAFRIESQAKPSSKTLLSALRQTADVIDVSVANDRLSVVCWPDARHEICALLSAQGCAVQEIVQMNDPVRSFGFGLLGDLPEPMAWRNFQTSLQEKITTNKFALAGSIPDHVQRVAYCPGSGGDLVRRAFDLGAQVYITGDLKYHQAQQALGRGLAIDVGHFSLEESMMMHWTDALATELEQSSCEARYFPGRDPFLPMDAYTGNF